MVTSGRVEKDEQLQVAGDSGREENQINTLV